jgi:hypothetical protein
MTQTANQGVLDKSWLDSLITSGLHPISLTLLSNNSFVFYIILLRALAFLQRLWKSKATTVVIKITTTK